MLLSEIKERDTSAPSNVGSSRQTDVIEKKERGGQKERRLRHPFIKRPYLSRKIV